MSTPRLLPLVLVLLALIPSATAAQHRLTTEEMTNLHPREIGPAVTGGRIADVTADPANPSTLYIASASGGVWKSTTQGQRWEPLTDDLPVSAFGAIALAPSDPEVVWIGSGEQNNRQSTSWGNGVYRSTDGGATWTHTGLVETRHIGKIEVHPHDPEVAYVAALGNLWAPNAERGVFRTTDGGASWEKVLYIDELTGAVDLVLDPLDPDVLYAATYQRIRRTWGFNGGGPGSGIWKTTDGGESWSELTHGLPDEEMGRIGLAISASSPNVLNALIETGRDATTGTYRSEDGGARWERVSDLDIRPMYYSEIFIDPTLPSRVYTMATNSYRSDDGGRTWTEIAQRPTYDVRVHADQHALWIDPNDSDHLYMGGDAGLHESFDAGVNWRKINNFVISQFYAIGLDMKSPYTIYGGLQDNHSFVGPSETRRWVGIVNDDWQQVGFGDGMYWQPNPFDVTEAYGTSNGGSYFLLDTETGGMLDISPREGEDDDFRFDWTSPIAASMHDPNTVYALGNHLFISTDRGSSWRKTEDLTRRIDRDTLLLGGRLGAEIAISRNDGTSSYGEGVTLAESPVDPLVLWLGFDDGNVQVTTDGGRSFTEVSGNVPGLPPHTYPSRVLGSIRGPGVAYATFDAHRDGDFAPYVYRTGDYGRTWTPLHDGLPTGSVNVIVEHPDNPDVLFLGTEHHAFASTDAGATWAKIPNLPTTAYDDMKIHPREKDLVFGTHGRGIRVLDDTRVFAELHEATGPAHLFSIPAREIFVYWKDTSYRADAEYAGENPPDGVEITYRLGAGSGPAELSVTNARGDEVARLDVPSSPGVHRVNWDLRWHHDTATWERFDHELLARPVGGRGTWVSPGTYTVTLEARGTRHARTVHVLPDPKLDLTQLDYETRENFMLQVEALMRTAEERMAAGELTRQEVFGLARSLGANGMNGGGVRPGTLRPPTEQQWAALRLARERLGGGR
ncbi:MAG: hypothetical protein RQ745_06065 [Longimicrobiales bacterium]|nr:hypothetical protein [Longimicrobiales bacterium]